MGLKAMGAIAAECVRVPGRVSIWDQAVGKYVCKEDSRYSEALRDQSSSAPSPIDPQFKLVFLTATIGTFVFVVICVATTIIAGKELPPTWEKLIQSLLDLAKIGFGAIAGLLGGKSMSQRGPTSN